MQSLAARVASFSPPKLSKKRVAGSSKQPWPHPPSFIATPHSLAEAGFYHAPSETDLDNVACFMCDKQLSEWEVHDDPRTIHIAKCPSCPWVLVHCKLADEKDKNGMFTFEHPSRIPSSRKMEKARLETFRRGKDRWWPHDLVHEHGAVSRQMAKAGFTFTPADEVDDDTATCLYCGTVLNGWEADDDPLQEHIRRETASSCAFILSLPPSTKATTKKAAIPEDSKFSEVESETEPLPTPKPTRSTRAKKKPPSKTMQESEAEALTEAPSEMDAEIPVKAAGRRSRKPVIPPRTPGKAARPANNLAATKTAGSSLALRTPARTKTRRTTTKAVVEHPDLERTDDTTIPLEPVAKLRPKSTRSRKTVARPDIVKSPQDGAEEGLPEPQTKSQRTRRTIPPKATILLSDLDPNESQHTGASPKKATTAKTKAKVAPRRGRDDHVQHLEHSLEQVALNEPTDSQEDRLAKPKKILPEIVLPTLVGLKIGPPRGSKKPRSASKNAHKPDISEPAKNAEETPDDTKSSVEPVDDSKAQQNHNAGPSTSTDLLTDLSNTETPPFESLFPGLEIPLPLTDGRKVEIPQLSEAERQMTVEDWIRYEMERQYQVLKTDGELRIHAFKRRGDEVRTQIESL